ncbi:AIPR family protein [Massilia sp. X63]|uniref:AIPR family protein n=1 Tax=Massilia sp. X63 TaxID=3237285 RepID=UPI0034DD26DB
MDKKTNDQIILEQIIKERWEESQDGSSISEYFEIYAATELLKNQDLSYDDIEYGIVGNGGDGGIDSIYTFINGELLKEDTPINATQKKNTIELVIIQSKTSPTFKEDAVVRFRESAEDLFNLANATDDFAARYNKDIREKVELFRKAYGLLAKTFPKLIIRYFYVTQGVAAHPNVEGKVDKLREVISSMFSNSEFSFEFVGASRLLELTRDIPTTSRTLEVAESPIGTAGGSYICLVDLKSYFKFISDAGALARSLFESNVRDYQGSVIVNTGIRQTLQNAQSEDFWYLNNGVTIITPKAVLAGKQLTIEDPQIVNGLQTSHEIYQHFSELSEDVADKRTVLVRIICEKDEPARDRIIRATNSQTAIPPASLRSSDEIHRNIEDFLKANGFYYDRKKNYYKNKGMPSSQIISIPYMAQAMMAMILQKPDQARARPSTLLNSDAEYKRIFSLDMPIDVYLKVIQIMRTVERKMRDLEIDRKTSANIKYYVAMIYAISLTGTKYDIAVKLNGMAQLIIDTDELTAVTLKVKSMFEDAGGTDQVAKGSAFAETLLAAEMTDINAMA